MTDILVLMVEDLMFAPRLENLANQAGYEPVFASDEAALTKVMRQSPRLAMVDLASTTFNWEMLVRFIRGPHKKNNHVPVIGFGPHTDLALRDRALAAGCTAVVARSAVVGDFARLVEKNLWKVNEAWCAEPLPSLVRQGIEQFNREEFFTCHDTLEDAWNAESRPLRILYQGILQIAVGYFHITRQNWRGAVKVLERGIPKAAHFRPTCQGIDVDDLILRAQEIQKFLLEIGPDDPDALATIRFPRINVR